MAGKGAGSQLEEQFAFQIAAVKLPAPVREHKWHPARRWRFDFSWPAQRLAVEIEGGIWTGGRHTRGAGFEKDAEKYNAASLEGWRVLRFSGRQVKSGEAITQVEKAIQGAGTR